MNEEKKAIIKKQIHEIIDILMDANGYESRQRSLTGTLPTIFIYYSGHVNMLSVDLHKDGWKAGDDVDKKWEFRLNDTIPDETINSINAEISDAMKGSKEKEVDVLRRDVQKKENSINEQKAELRKMKKTLRKMEKQNETKI